MQLAFVLNRLLAQASLAASLRRWTLIWQKFPLCAPGSLVLLETFSFGQVSLCASVHTWQLVQRSEDFATINRKDFSVCGFKDMTTLPTVF